ncbi:MAG TPA: fumarylacetoacetate hydrolase family protein [Puia sp.]|jgi:2-dehydro-3-deoxy-D-arabinonate dehydratase
MQLYKTSGGHILQHDGKFFLIAEDWDKLINRPNLYARLLKQIAGSSPLSEEDANKTIRSCLQPPIGRQEVWASGVTYLRSRDARMEESEQASAADCYQRVYEAERPELFFKSLAHRVAGHNEKVNIRDDSFWDVPEPELALYINAAGSIEAYTIGNDMSSRSIEGENPLYLPQAKMFERCAALGPCLFITNTPISPGTVIQMEICRNGNKMFSDSTTLSKMKRSLPELAGWLYREMDFEHGCFLMTGTCIVPPTEFTLRENDIVNISIDGIGVLTNIIAKKGIK